MSDYTVGHTGYREVGILEAIERGIQAESERMAQELNATLDLSADPLTLPIEERPVIYVAGFYSASPAHGLANAMAAFQPLVDAGWVPLVPHVSFISDAFAPNPPAFWYAYDLALLARCDAMYVCPDALTAESTGVRDEIAFCTRNDIPVFYTIVPASERYER